MKEFFNRLNPIERRFVVGVMVFFFVVINIFFVWPHRGDWSDTQKAMKDARDRLFTFNDGIGRMGAVQAAIDKYRDQGGLVPPEEQALQFFKVIVNQSAASGVNMLSTGGGARQSLNTNNPYFVEQNQTITTQSGEKQLVDFLYNIGNGNSLIRVKALSVQPDQPRQGLTARITLVASYQKKVPGPGAPAAAKAPAPAPAPTSAKTPPAPATPKPATPTPAGAAFKPPPPNAAGAQKPPLPGSMNRPATNKFNPLTPNKK